jgi:hypothetical protein
VKKTVMRQSSKELPRPPVIFHPASAISSCGNEPIVLPRFMVGIRILTNRSAENNGAITMPNEVRLFFWPAFVAPFKPIVDSEDGAMGPYGSKKKVHGQPSPRARL